MPEVKITPTAESDFDEVFAYIAVHSVDSAKKFFRELAQNFGY